MGAKSLGRKSWAERTWGGAEKQASSSRAGGTTEKEEKCRYAGCYKKIPSPGVPSLLTTDTLRV